MSTAPIARQAYTSVVPVRTLTPETPVVIVFRGGPPIVDKFDGRDIILPAEANAARLADVKDWDRRYYPPCEIEGIAYAIAVHIRERAIVPATRDPFNSKKASYRVGILSTPSGTNQDRPEYCEPFTTEQLALFGKLEGLNRDAFEDSRRNGTTMETQSAISHVGNLHEQLNAEPDADTLAPPADHEGLREVHAGASGYQGDDASRNRRGRPKFKDDK